MNDSNDVELLWDPQCNVTESPVWDGRQRRVLFADVHGGRILSYGVDDGARQEWQLPAQVSSFGLCESGRFVVALLRQIVILDPATGEHETLIDSLPEPAGNRFLDGKVGPDGCFWVGSFDVTRNDHQREPLANAGLYRVSPAGDCREVSTGYVTSNGLAWAPDGRTMYHSDSYFGFVDAWDFDATSGSIGGRRRFADMTDEVGRPDGAACDVDGSYWSAGVSAGYLNCFDPTGQLTRRIEMPCPAPSMPCFADDHLYVTSLRRANLPAETPGNLAGLFRLRAPAVGATISRFADR